jgi:hypothetical protein
MRLIAGSLFAVLLLTSCSASATPDPIPSDSVSQSSATNAGEALSAALEKSVTELQKNGVMEFYANDGQPTFIGVYDPNHKQDYRGAGLVIDTDEVELLLELDMYAVFRIQRALEVMGNDAVVLDGDSFTLTIDPTKNELQYFPAQAVITIDTDGLVEEIAYPAEQDPDLVSLVYEVDEFGTDILTRANKNL